MKFLLITSLCAICTISCRQNNLYNKDMAVIDAYSLKLKQEKGITCGMYGLDYSGKDNVYDGKLHTISLGYDTEKRMKYKEARALCYEVVDGLLAHLNKNEKIRPHLYHYPLTYADLDIHLTFDFNNRHSHKRDDVASIHIDNNEILYLIVDKETPEDPNSSDPIATYCQQHRCVRRKLPEPTN